MARTCYRRFDNGTYLLTCGLDEHTSGDHKEMDGDGTWPFEAGFSDKYTGAPLKYDAFKVTPEVLEASEGEPGDTQTLDEAVASVPVFWKGVKHIVKEQS